MSAQKLFFSYSRTDSAFALKLAKDLRDAGADIWIDQLDIPAGNHWDSAVEKALNTASYVLVILTPASTASTNVMDEVSFALESGKKVIPVLLEDTLAPFRLRRLQRIDFTTDYNTGFSQLVQALSSVIQTQKSPTADPAHVTTHHHHETAVPDSKEAARKDNQLWEEACRVNTIVSYKKYLNESLTGENSAEARLLIKQIELEQTEDELEALLWQKAKSENNKNIFLHYLQEYPQGNYKQLALAAIAELEREEKEEQRRIKELEKQQEKEKALFEKQEREKALKEKQEKDKALQLEREKTQQAEREKSQRERQEKERVMQIERERAQREKEEKEKVRLQEKEKAQREKQEREKVKQQEKEKALLVKQESDKLKKAEKEKALQERQLNPGQQPPAKSQKKLVMIGGGVLALVIGIWGIVSFSSGSGKGDDELSAWNAALSQNDSVAYASYLQTFPSGQYATLAKGKSDSLFAVNQARRDSEQAALLASQTPSEPTPVEPTPTPVEPTTTTKTDTKKPTPVTPKQDPVKKPTAPPPVVKKDTPEKPSDAKFTLGQQHQGGVIVYINPTGEHGLIAALKDEGYLNWAAAQRKCASYKVEGFSDWRLPTKEELGILYKNRRYMGEHAKGIYWSSTAEDKDLSWAQNFINGNMATVGKQSTNVVRAVHSF